MLPRCWRKALQHGYLDILESQIPEREQPTSAPRLSLGLQLFALRLLVRAGSQPRDVGGRGEPALDVRGVPEVPDRHQAGETVRDLNLRQAVRVRMEPVHPAGVVGRDHVAVLDVAMLDANEGRSRIERTGISRGVRTGRGLV